MGTKIHLDNPPINEVVCNIIFDKIEGLVPSHLGLLWSKYKEEFTKTESHPPIFEGTLPPSDVFLKTRVWFVHSNDHEVIQVQDDRFINNWRRRTDASTYPSYNTLIEKFQDRYKIFLSFIEEEKLGAIEPKNLQLSYINSINMGEGWSNFNDISNLFPNLISNKNIEGLELNSINYHGVFNVLEMKSTLNIHIRSAKRRTDELPVIMFELRITGFPENKEWESIWKWFDMAHDSIIKSFLSTTNENVQKDIWKVKYE